MAQIMYQCVGCGTKKEVELKAGQQQAQAPICCGRPMKEVSRK